MFGRILTAIALSTLLSTPTHAATSTRDGISAYEPPSTIGHPTRTGGSGGRYI